MRRTYSQAEKDKALAVCVESGQYRASRQLGIPLSTVNRWAKAAGIGMIPCEKAETATAAREAYCTAKRAELKQLLIANAVDLAQRMHEPHVDFKSAGPLGPMEVTFPKAPAQACQQYATAIGILLDKFRLESGEVTSRDERHVIAQSEFDRKVQDLLADMDARAEGQVLQEPHGGRAGGDPVAVGGNGNGSGKVSQ